MGRKLDDLNQLHVSEFGTYWWHVFCLVCTYVKLKN